MGLVGERHGLDHGPGNGQAFLLTEAALHIATSSLTLIQTFLLGGDLHPSPQEGGSKTKLCSSFVWMHGREHKAWQMASWMELQHCRAEPAKLLRCLGLQLLKADVQRCCKALGHRPTRYPRVRGSSACALPAPPSHPECPPKPQVLGATTTNHQPEPR